MFFFTFKDYYYYFFFTKSTQSCKVGRLSILGAAWDPMENIGYL